MNWQDFDFRQLTGRSRRLLHEWRELDRALEHRDRIEYSITKRNAQGLPTEYLITYRIRSICGVERVERLNEPGVSNPPIFASEFFMRIVLPPNYPCVDAPVEFWFLTQGPEEEPIAHPWHPNIRYFGEFAGRVCLNTPDTYTGLDWCVDRVAHYLSYERYHAIQEPPYPEDFKVAEWVVRQGEPNDWVCFNPQATNE
ncbi:MAG TPA: hypothetical protein IAA13_09145 [Candidatus Alistipes merdigallinarum]|nr:hypothetical protein [Candidatus Alistipes merdigallinarum]